MSQRYLTTLLALASLSLPSAALACLWDVDTLRMERSRFPDTLELITGKFLRHSKEFYEWRIRDRLEKLQGDSDNYAYYDDLAVAYDKTGQHQKAIETMLEKDKIRPGLYETEANLGTFYIHAGQLEKGLEHIDRALRINLDAHFGREKYQRLLVEYILTRRHDGVRSPPLWRDLSKETAKHVTSFREFLVGKQNPPRWTEADRKAARQGILGMMKFGNHESPVLLEALANLLGSHPEDAKRLAARAYLKGSYEVGDEAARLAYREMAREVLRYQTRTPQDQQQLSLEELEQSFQRELTETRQWYEEVRQNELTWIREGKDPEQEFNRLYYEEPQVSTALADHFQAVLASGTKTTLVVAATSGVLCLAFWPIYRATRRRASA
jgi:tetratricopeptide (TPR) repeat protein